MQVGDRVRIKESVIFYHHPLHRNTAYDGKGLEGEVTAVLSDWQGRPISANFPVIVQFQVEGAKRPFKAHLRENELEVLG
ncbi:ferredoxin-thioredoxin reductase variable chain [Oscillatoria sp. CS-180]|uniref:ferredoxin-thioredoxin reductase variable chain n=1 Tax=Oscillatoria sp. CS-180 TaxID=3021720 RepID=UPI00232E822D|nr:ferredoxin-thioredoxin reductase variable chain [Oscillatoria sp. CS-180]MDB9529264.1 ferredoxin-thioredoxin reductase variable chain [Oscillatoria sp. CS-180]